MDITERHEADKQIRESEIRYRRIAAIVESSDDAILSKNLDGIITSWNSGAERLFGYTADEAIGKPVTMLIPVDRHDEGRSPGQCLGLVRDGRRLGGIVVDLRHIACVDGRCAQSHGGSFAGPVAKQRHPATPEERPTLDAEPVRPRSWAICGPITEAVMASGRVGRSGSCG